MLFHVVVKRNRLAVLNDNSTKGLVDCNEVLYDLVNVIFLRLLPKQLKGEGFPVMNFVIVNSDRNELNVFLVL